VANGRDGNAKRVGDLPEAQPFLDQRLELFTL
jgi:hypothetical protein